jgi:hypothetical protein
MAELLVAMLAIIATWSACFLVFTGVGLSVRWAYGDRLLTNWQDIPDAFWLGWTVVLILLLLWHLALPVSWLVAVLALAVGAVGMALFRSQLGSLVKRTPLRATILAVVLSGIAAALAANQSLGPPWGLHDTGMYHLMAVRWAKTYPVVPGLGNLQVHLAHKTSYFLYAATLDTGPWQHGSYHIANGLLVLAMFVQLVLSGLRILNRNRPIRLYDLFYLLMVGVVMGQLDERLSTLNYDLAVTLLALVLGGQLLAILESPDEVRARRGFPVFQIGVIAAASSTLKLSMAVFAGLTFLIAMTLWWRWQKQSPVEAPRVLLATVAIAVIPIVAWSVHGIILSGYPLFPMTIGALPVDWLIPYPLAQDEANWVLSWARAPDEHWKDVLGNTAWFSGWVQRLLDHRSFWASSGFLACGIALLLYQRVFQKQRSLPGRLWLGLLPASVSLVFWFVSAPAYRFAEGAFWTLGAGTLALALYAWVGLADRTAYIFAMAITIVMVGVSLLRFDPVGRSEGGQALHPIPDVELNAFETDSGLVVWFPETGTLCWDAPIPCTNAPQPGLQSREEGNLRRGFRLVGTPYCYDWEVSGECLPAR